MQVRISHFQSARDAMAHSARLPGNAAAEQEAARQALEKIASEV